MIWALPRAVMKRLLPCLLGVGTCAPGPLLATELPTSDSLLTHIGALRHLKPLGSVPIRVSSRDQVRLRLEEILQQEQVEPRLEEEQKLLRFLGLLPEDLHLPTLYLDLLEEQLAGFYDLDKRELVLADWLPLDAQLTVANHELAHALQDQHFSLRVRRKLGFEDTEAEAAWHALLEGDAMAVMLEAILAPQGRHFDSLTEAGDTTGGVSALFSDWPGLETNQYRSAPEIVRAAFEFPYVQGLRFVSHLYRAGGWGQVDRAFIHPPVSSEQILHPDHYQPIRDEPVRIRIPDLRGLLGSGYRPVSAGVLGEYDLYAYLNHYADSEIASIAAEGWSGCAYELYEGGEDEPASLVLVSIWDSEDDAVEFFGGLIGTLEARYPEQRGHVEASRQDHVVWLVDEKGERNNLLRLEKRRVVCLEQVPQAALGRIVRKLGASLEFRDPTPEFRAVKKSALPWERMKRAAENPGLTIRLELPEGWEPLDVSGDPHKVLEARRDETWLRVIIDRAAAPDLGVDGYARIVGRKLQEQGREIYVQLDRSYTHSDGKLHLYAFNQMQGPRQVVHYIAVADLREGYGYLLMSSPKPDVVGDGLFGSFRTLLDAVKIMPEPTPSPAEWPWQEVSPNPPDVPKNKDARR